MEKKPESGQIWRAEYQRARRIKNFQSDCSSADLQLPRPRVVVAYPQNRENYPSRERVWKSRDELRHKCLLVSFYLQTKGGCKGRRLGQPLDRAERNGGGGGPVDRSRHEGEVCANIISVVLRKEAFISGDRQKRT